MTRFGATRPHRPTPSRRPAFVQAGLLLLIVGLLIGRPTASLGQDASNRLDRIMRASNGIVLPNVALPADLRMSARRATTWASDGTRRVVLEGDAALSIGSYGFRADNAVVFITQRRAPGVAAYQLEIYLDEVRELGGHGPVETRARTLLVTGIIDGRIQLDADRLTEQPMEGPLVAAATARVNRFHANLRSNIVALRESPAPEPAAPGRRVPPPDAPEAPEALEPPDAPAETDEPTITIEPQPPVDRQPDEPPAEPGEPPLAAGRVFFNAGKIIYQEGESESYALLIGDVTVMYYDARTRQSLSLSADKAVIFTEPGAMGGATETSADVVRGVYLEDNVIATNGEYTLRGPRMFYDLRTDRAAVLDAVFYTWSIENQVPLYVRADRLLQISRNQWRAEDGVISTSEFAEPHFSIGANELTVRQEPADDGRIERRFEARGMTGEVAGVPLFYWPKVTGKMADSPLKRVEVGFDDRRGASIRTRWDAFALAGVEAPDDVSLTWLAEFYSERGPATGLELEYDVPRAFGDLDVMGMYDDGKDEPGGRRAIDPEDEFRGLTHWQHRHYLADNWEASVEFSYISDPTYLEEWFTDAAYGDKPWETSFYLKNQQDDWAFTFLAKYDLLDFVPQLTQLQTPGYTVNKLPEIGYYRVGTSLFDDAVTWYSENRASVVSLNFPEQAPRELGFTAAESVALFGIASATRFDNALNTAGLDDDTVGRVDSRQELAMPLKIGPIDVVPYVAGRITVYDDDFNQFAGNDDNVRFFGQAGIKLHTAFSRTYDWPESKLLDIHRLRHIIEPSVHATFAYTNVDQDVLPVFDVDVESLAEGGTVRLGLRNTFQTRRGMEGNWRSVDVFRLDTDFVIQDDKTLRESPIARFFDHRPEFSLGGDHFWTEMAWQVTDALSTVANLTYSFDSSEIQQWNWGLTYDHNPRLTSFMRIRRIDARDTTILHYGIDYLLSAKYHLALAQSIDLADNDNRAVNVRLTRRFPRMLVTLAFSFDEIGDVASVGLALTPEGAGGQGAADRNPFVTNY